jgi:hypothetical protein
MVPGLLGLVAVEGTAFRSEVDDACLDVGVSYAAESHAYHIVMHRINVAQTLCNCLLCVWGRDVDRMAQDR